MAWTRSELKSKAKVSLKANYGWSVLAGLIFSIVLFTWAGSSYYAAGQKSEEMNLSMWDTSALFVGLMIVLGLVAVVLVIDLAVCFFLWNPIRVGCYKFFKDGSEGVKEPKVKDIFRMITQCGNKVRVTMFLRSLFTLLWSCLLFIPGIVKHYEYAMIPYLLIDHPEMDRKEIFAESKRMMQGNKWNAFVLDLSFLGWQILSACTFEILSIFYVAPYMYYTDAELYLALKKN